MNFAIPSHKSSGSRYQILCYDQSRQGGQPLQGDQSGQHRKVTASSESLQYCKVTAGRKPQGKAVSNTVQESDRKDGYNDVNVEKFSVALKSRIVTSTKELETTAREMAKESYVTMASFDSPSNSSEILVARKKRVYKLMD